jgi:hypothetical protein
MNAIHLNLRPYKCKACDKRFTRPSDRTRHETEAHTTKKFICHGRLASGQERGCRKRFSRQLTLSKHQVDCRGWKEGQQLPTTPMASRIAFPSVEATTLRHELTIQLRDGRIHRCSICAATRSTEQMPSFLHHLIGHLEDILYRSFSCHRCGASFPLETFLGQHQQRCSTAPSEHFYQCFKVSTLTDRHSTQPKWHVWGCNASTHNRDQYEHHLRGHDVSGCWRNRSETLNSLKTQVVNHVNLLVPKAVSIPLDNLESYLKALRRQVYVMDYEITDSDQIRNGGDTTGVNNERKIRVDGVEAQFLINALGVAALFEEVGG